MSTFTTTMHRVINQAEGKENAEDVKEFHNVTVLVSGTHKGVDGVLRIQGGALRWNGRREKHQRPVLGEVRNSGNQVDGNECDGPKWSFSFPGTMIIKACKRENELIVHAGGRGGGGENEMKYVFTFKNNDDANLADKSWKVVVAGDCSQSQIFDEEELKTRSVRKRKSISYDDFVDADDGRDAAATTAAAATVDENVMGVTTVIESDITKIRRLARIVSSKHASFDTRHDAAMEISGMTRYPLLVGEDDCDEKPKGKQMDTVFPGRRVPEELELFALRPMIAEMRKHAKSERQRMQNQTGIIVVSPRGYRRGYTFMDEKSNTSVSPRTYEKRYRTFVLMEGGEEEPQEGEKDQESKDVVAVAEVATIVPTSLLVRFQESVVIRVGDFAMPRAPLINQVLDIHNNNDMPEPKQRTPKIDTQAELFSRALGLEQEKLNQAFDRALDEFTKRKKELECMYRVE